MPRAPLLLALACLASPLAAQSVRGRILGPDGGAIPGAIVVLSDSAGAERGRMLSSAIGSYLFRAPGAGRYTLQVLRIGYPAFRSAPFTLAASDALELSPALPDDPIVLEELTVRSGGEACHADEAVAGPTALLLDEVQKAFGSAQLALADRDLRFDVMYHRLREGRHVERFEDSVAQVLRTWPVHSLPPAQLRDHGFVQAADSVDGAYVPIGAEGRVWFGPDPATLFSAPFLASHCYRVTGEGDDRQLIGLAFTPVPGRHAPDIRGTLWLDRHTLALRRIGYEYVNLPRHLTRGTGERPRGSMELLRLPTGLWIVSRWSLRVPVERLQDHAAVGVAGWLEQGGEIRGIRTAMGARVY